MKTVFSKTSEGCEAWAAQETPSGRTSSNTSFRDQTLYSYSTAIARIIRCPQGGDVVDMTALVSSQSYSTSTSKVQGEAFDAARRAGLAVFKIKRLGDDVDSVIANLDDYTARIEAKCVGIEKAVRWDTAAGWRREAMQLVGEAYLFARTFGADWTFPGRNPMNVAGKDMTVG